MSEPLDTIGMPTTTITKPTATNFHYLTVTAGPSRSSSSIILPVGVSLITLDFSIPTGQLRGQLRGSIDGTTKYFSNLTDYVGDSTETLRIVNDDPAAWIGVYGLPSQDAVPASRVAVTIYPMLAA